MPKKTRKAKERASQRAIPSGRYAPISRTIEPSDQEFTAAPASAPVRSTPVVSSRAVSSAARASTPITVDYGYVFRDLRRIAILAVLFFGIMFVLWYVIEVMHIAIIPGIL